MPNCHHIFTHNDLDGAGSVLAYIWNKPKEDSFQYTPISNLEISKLKYEITNTHNLSNIFVFDLSLREEFLPELNNPNITFIDHHKSSAPFITKFNNARVLHKEYSSNTLLIYKLFKNDKIQITNEQKTLIALIDDFDSNKLQLPASSDLNLLFWTEYKNRFSDFIKDYYNGFKPFTEKQKRAIEFIKKEESQEASKLPVFFGEVTIDNKKKKVYAVMAERMFPQVVEYFVNKYSPDIFLFINTKSEKVSIRQCSIEDPIDCSVFAQKYCEGGGHANAAGGKITPLFMEITKNLKPL